MHKIVRKHLFLLLILAIWLGMMPDASAQYPIRIGETIADNPHDLKTSRSDINESRTTAIIPRISAPEVRDTSICQGESIDLSVLAKTTAPGGSLVWYANAGNRVLPAVPVLNNPAPGSHICYVTQKTDSGESEKVPIKITVFASPAVNIINKAGVTELTCTHPVIRLTATGGGSYFWNNGLGDAADITVTAPGNYTVIVTANGCTEIESINITENKTAPVAAIINKTGVTELTCTHPVISLEATGGVSYLWNNGLGVNAGVTVTTPNTYTVAVKAANGCTAAASVIITSNKEGLEAGITNHTRTTVLTCSTTEIILEATGGVSYSWNNGLGDDDYVIVTEPGTYTVTVTAANGCTETKSITITTDKHVPAAITNNSNTTVLTCTTKTINLTATGGVSYSWSGGLGSNANATVTTSGTYVITVTGFNGCIATASITITAERNLPSAIITNNSGFTELTCAKPGISLTASGGVTYAWSNSSGGDLGNNANLTVTAAGIYTVTVTSANGCDAAANITITADKTPPPASITSNSGTDILTCTESTINLTATGGVSYSWDKGLGNSANATVTSAGTYTVTVTAANGCTAAKSITITSDGSVPVAGIINNSNTTVLTCTVKSISLTATGGGTYSWNNSLGTNATVTVTTPGTYVATVTGSNGCTDTKSVTITSDESAPDIRIASNTGSNLLSCTVSSIILTANGGNSYVWDNGLGEGANITVTTSGTYTVTAKASNGCTGRASITITRDQSLPTIKVNDAEICLGGMATLTASGADTYTWMPSVGLSATTGANVTASPTVTTAYAIEGVVAETGCKSITTATVYVETPVTLKLTVTSENIELGDDVTITVSVDRPNHRDFEWFINDRTYKTVKDYSITLKPPAGKQHFRVNTATKGLNCPSSSGINVTVNETIPNVINPYNPDGANCCFMKSNGAREGYRVEIYNRHMQKVFEGNDGWDGTYRGDLADPGTYFYRLYKKDGQMEQGALEVVKF